MAPFPAPPHQTVRADFPHTAFGVPLTRGMRGFPAWHSWAAIPGIPRPDGVLAVLTDNHAALPSVPGPKQPGSLRSTDVIPLPRYYGPLRLLPRPGIGFGFALCDAVAGSPPATEAGLPSCACVLSRRAVPTTPPQPPGIEARCMAGVVSAFVQRPKTRPADWRFSRLAWVHGCYGPPFRSRRTLAGRRFDPMNLNAPVARSRPMGRYTLNRQLAWKAPFILQNHKRLRSAYGQSTILRWHP